MTAFTLIPFEMRLAIIGLLFIAELCMLELCIFKYISVGKFRRCLPDTVCFLLTLVLISTLRASSEKDGVRFEINTPYILYIIIAVLMFAYFIFGIIYQRKKNRLILTPNSVRQALDNMDSGICFADTEGRIILINRAMGRLISGISGAYPQTLDEVVSALKSLAVDENGLYKCADGTVLSFGSEALNGRSVDGYTQLSLQDVTDLYRANEELKKSNEQLRQTNEKMQLMYESLADRIREQETLNLKIRVHNDIGRSLIELSDIIEGRAETDTEKQLAALQDAVGYFSNNRSAAFDTFEKAQERALRMNVSLVLAGMLPDGKSETELLVAACDECVTNCKTHADGKTVFAGIAENDGVYTVKITNDGAVPTSKIREGGGLTSLRRKVETAGGTMTVQSKPEFALIITIPKEEKRYD